MDQLPPFPGFRPEAFGFLRDLAANNDREWFKPRKTTFDDELMWPLRCLVADIGRAAAQAGLPLKGDPSKGLFRIYRDVRFSKNKEPYKRHVAAVLSRSGSRKAPGGLYVHIEPGESFAAAGLWETDSRTLRRFRERIVEDAQGFFDLMDPLEANGMKFGDHFGKLKRLPRGFERVDDERVGDYIRHKSFILQRSFSDEALHKSSFTDEIIGFFRELLPFMTLVWEILDSKE